MNTLALQDQDNVSASLDPRGPDPVDEVVFSNGSSSAEQETAAVSQGMAKRRTAFRLRGYLATTYAPQRPWLRGAYTAR